MAEEKPYYSFPTHRGCTGFHYEATGAMPGYLD